MIANCNNILRRLALLIALVPAAALAVDRPPAPASPPAQAQEVSQVPPVPMTPAAVTNLLYARPFKLEHGYEYEWRAEKPAVTAGWLLVLEVNTALVFPRQTAEPVLYVGKTTGERVNIGHVSGRIVVIVPSDLNEKGEMALDLNEALMWFGTPELPEQVDALKVERQRKAALAAGIAPFSKEIVDNAKAMADAQLKASDRDALQHAVADLIKVYSPQETDLADQILTAKTPDANE